MDEVGYWSRPLAPIEINQLYNGSKGISYPFPISTTTAPQIKTVITGATTTTYLYGQSTGANPDAVTQIGNGTATTTYSYDLNGNLTQAISPQVTWNYTWDYLNRMLSASNQYGTSTYAYDPSGARVMQTIATATSSATTFYPNKFYSLTRSVIATSTYATSTNYIYLGDSLVATIDQATKNGATSSAPIIRYVHPDHLGSTNVVTDASGTVTQLLEYFPYGATRTSYNTNQTNEQRQYIGQFADQTNLDYLNARYYDAARGQFVSEDPVFWGKQNLADPQSFNTYSYAEDNPITKEDPTGLASNNTAQILSLMSQILSLMTQLVVSMSSSSGGSNGSSSSSATSKSSGSANGSSASKATSIQGSSGGGVSVSPSTYVYSGGFGIMQSSASGWPSNPANPDLGSLPIRPTALAKLQKLSEETGMSIDEILLKSSQSANGFIDLNNDANINIYSPKPAKGELIRVTTNPEGDAIISAGTSESSQVENGISSGRFIPEDPFFIGEPIAPLDIIIY